jgi:hypothetical protein
MVHAILRSRAPAYRARDGKGEARVRSERGPWRTLWINSIESLSGSFGSTRRVRRGFRALKPHSVRHTVPGAARAGEVFLTLGIKARKRRRAGAGRGRRAARTPPARPAPRSAPAAGCAPTAIDQAVRQAHLPWLPPHPSSSDRLIESQDSSHAKISTPRWWPRLGKAQSGGKAAALTNGSAFCHRLARAGADDILR